MSDIKPWDLDNPVDLVTEEQATAIQNFLSAIPVEDLAATNALIRVPLSDFDIQSFQIIAQCYGEATVNRAINRIVQLASRCLIQDQTLRFLLLAELENRPWLATHGEEEADINLSEETQYFLNALGLENELKTALTAVIEDLEKKCDDNDQAMTYLSQLFKYISDQAFELHTPKFWAVQAQLHCDDISKKFNFAITLLKARGVKDLKSVTDRLLAENQINLDGNCIRLGENGFQDWLAEFYENEVQKLKPNYQDHLPELFKFLVQNINLRLWYDLKQKLKINVSYRLNPEKVGDLKRYAFKMKRISDFIGPKFRKTVLLEPSLNPELYYLILAYGGNILSESEQEEYGQKINDRKKSELLRELRFYINSDNLHFRQTVGRILDLTSSEFSEEIQQIRAMLGSELGRNLRDSILDEIDKIV